MIKRRRQVDYDHTKFGLSIEGRRFRDIIKDRYPNTEVKRLKVFLLLGEKPMSAHQLAKELALSPDDIAILLQGQKANIEIVCR